MSTTTTNYGLVKPQLTDSADITAMNGNWDKIDTELKSRATLGSDGKVPSSQLPSMNYIPTSEKGKASGVASLDSSGKLPSGQLPSHTHDDRYYTESEVNNLINGLKTFVINITDNGDNFIADKTFSEVLAAYNAGKTLMAYYNDYKLPLTMANVSQYFAFQTGTDSGYVAVSIMVDNTVFGIFETFSYSDHHHFPSDIKSGTFASYVKANASNQDPATSLIRNSKLVSADTNPTVNGEICWTYK